MAGGAVIELEKIESPAKAYPETTALIDLLDTPVDASGEAPIT